MRNEGLTFIANSDRLCDGYLNAFFEAPGPPSGGTEKPCGAREKEAVPAGAVNRATAA